MPDGPWEAALSAITSTEKTRSPRVYTTPTWYWVLIGVLVAVVALTAYPALTQAPHTPGIGDLFPAAIFGEGTFFEFNRLTLARLIVAVVIGAVVAFGATHLKTIPARGQQLLELFAEFIRENIAISMLGNKQGRRYAPLFGMIFLGIFGMNVTGIIPGINIAASSVIAVPVVFALIAYVSFISAGIREHGAFHFFVGQLFPPGLPKPIYLMITPIEAFSTFIVRPATLAIRLLANMISGHMLLAVTYFGTATILEATGIIKSLALLTGLAIVGVTLFELFVALLQAYIFTMLTAVYIKLSVEAH
ncbi:MAG: ATP synthase F0 subunit A [Actinobacteria bacterium]|nr:MAG: ATP synthase F0 subunit A [Actinomycetota bacterium]